MESLFGRCSNLQTLSLNSFEASKVQYMNKIFNLDFRNITIISFGAIYQMFYDYEKLNYYIINIILQEESNQLSKYSMVLLIILHLYKRKRK